MLVAEEGVTAVGGELGHGKRYFVEDRVFYETSYECLLILFLVGFWERVFVGFAAVYVTPFGLRCEGGFAFL